MCIWTSTEATRGQTFLPNQFLNFLFFYPTPKQQKNYELRPNKKTNLIGLKYKKPLMCAYTCSIVLLRFVHEEWHKIWIFMLAMVSFIKLVVIKMDRNLNGARYINRMKHKLIIKQELNRSVTKPNVSSNKTLVNSFSWQLESRLGHLRILSPTVVCRASLFIII